MDRQSDREEALTSQTRATPEPAAWSSLQVPHTGATAQESGHPLPPSWAHWQGAGAVVEQPGFQLAPVWDVDPGEWQVNPVPASAAAGTMRQAGLGKAFQTGPPQPLQPHRNWAWGWA